VEVPLPWLLMRCAEQPSWTVWAPPSRNSKRATPVLWEVPAGNIEDSLLLALATTLAASVGTIAVLVAAARFKN
jgi:hypothetical protein